MNREIKIAATVAKQQRRLGLLIALGAVAIACITPGRADDAPFKAIPNHLFLAKKVPILYPPAPAGNRDRLITPPGENQYFPVRADGQPYVLNIDRTVNLTAALNQFYYNPKWRGEVWTPFDQIDSIERATRIMGTWREYDEFSELRIFNGFHKFFEKYSGFGP